MQDYYIETGVCTQCRGHGFHIDGLVQEKRNSIANALEYVFLALTHPHIYPSYAELSHGVINIYLYLVSFSHTEWDWQVKPLLMKNKDMFILQSISIY